MQVIAAHKKDIQPSELTLNWCVDIVKACGKRIGAMCLLANTPTNHVSVANDAYEQLQQQLGGERASTSLSPSSYGIDLYSYEPYSSVTRRSPSSPSASQSASVALTIKEKRRVLRVEAARAMLQQVSAYIQLRLQEEESKVSRAAGQGSYLDDHRRDPHYDLYRALGTMHHWLLADDSLPAETREQQRLMNIDDHNSVSGRGATQGQSSIAALLVDRREVPTYSYGALLQLITETDVGLLGKEMFPFEALTQSALKQTAQDSAAPCYASEGVEGCDAFIALLTPPPLPEITGDNAHSPSKSSPSTPRARSVTSASPTELLTPSFTFQLQKHLVSIFTVWAKAMTTYFLHCEILDELDRQRLKAEKVARETAERQQLELAQKEEEFQLEQKRLEYIRRDKEREIERLRLEAEQTEAAERKRKLQAERDREETEAKEREKKLMELREEQKQREAAVEAERLRLIQLKIDAEAALEQEKLRLEMEEEQRRKRAYEKQLEDEALQRQWQLERQAQEAAHRLALTEAAKKRDEELSRFEAERQKIAEEEKMLQEARARQANLKNQLVEEEEAARRLAASLAAQRRKQQEEEAADRIRRNLAQDEEERRRREAALEEERQLQEQEKSNQRRKAVFTRLKRIEDSLFQTEQNEEVSDRGRISLEEGADREWLSTLEVQEHRAAVARARAAKALRDEEELKQHQQELAQAEERMRNRLAKQRADEEARAQRAAEERAKLEAFHRLERAEIEGHSEQYPRQKISEEEAAARRSLIDHAYETKQVSQRKEQQRLKDEAEALRRAKEMDLVRRVREAELRRLKEEADQKMKQEDEERQKVQEEAIRRAKEEEDRLQEEQEIQKAAQRNKTARPPARPMLISHDGESTDEEDNDLRRRVEALERENKYLCEVVDGINTNHIRLHRHVLETEVRASRSPSRSLDPIDSPYHNPVGLLTLTTPTAHTAITMLSTRIDPNAADDLPLPKSEELAVPRRVSNNSPQRRKMVQPYTMGHQNSLSPIASSASPVQRPTVADRIRHEVATSRPQTANAARGGYHGLNSSSATVVQPSLMPDQQSTERELYRKIDALYGEVKEPSATAKSRPVTAAANGTRTYNGASAGLGGWNMYDQGGYSGAVGYTYDPQELDAPYLAIAANAPSWMHPKDLQQAREEHLRRIQRAMFGDQLGDKRSNAPFTVTTADANLLFSEEEMAIAQQRQRYEVRVVQQLLREIRLRGGLAPLYEADHRGMSAGPVPPSMRLLPEPCVKLDFGTLTPWITDTHLLLILNSLLESAKLLNVSVTNGARTASNGYRSAAEYPKTNIQSAEALTANIAATLRTIDISRCHYVSSESILYILSDLVDHCPNLLHVSINHKKFDQAVVPLPSTTAIASPDRNKMGYLTVDPIAKLENTLAAWAIEASRIR